MSGLSKLDRFAITASAASFGATGRIPAFVYYHLFAAYVGRFLVTAPIGQTIVGTTIICAFIQHFTGFDFLQHLWVLLFAAGVGLALSPITRIVAFIFFIIFSCMLVYGFVEGVRGYNPDGTPVENVDYHNVKGIAAKLERARLEGTGISYSPPQNSTPVIQTQKSDIRVVQLSLADYGGGWHILTLGMVGEQWMLENDQYKSIQAICDVIMNVDGVKHHRTIILKSLEPGERVVRGAAKDMDFDIDHPLSGKPLNDIETVKSCTAKHV